VPLRERRARRGRGGAEGPAPPEARRRGGLPQPGDGVRPAGPGGGGDRGLPSVVATSPPVRADVAPPGRRPARLRPAAGGRRRVGGGGAAGPRQRRGGGGPTVGAPGGVPLSGRMRRELAVPEGVQAEPGREDELAVQVVGPADGWVLERLARTLAAKLPYAEFVPWRPAPSPATRLAYYVHYALLDRPNGPI